MLEKSSTTVSDNIYSIKTLIEAKLKQSSFWHIYLNNYLDFNETCSLLAINSSFHDLSEKLDSSIVPYLFRSLHKMILSLKVRVSIHEGQHQISFKFSNPHKL